MFWIPAALVGGAILLGAALLSEAEEASTRWANKRKELEWTLEECEQEVKKATEDSLHELSFHELVDLHYASQKVANKAYELNKDASLSIKTISKTLVKAKDARNTLYHKLKQRDITQEKKAELRAEFNSYGELRADLFENLHELKAQQTSFRNKLKSFNNTTHGLKITIRDNCGERGRDWYRRLQERAALRKNNK